MQGQSHPQGLGNDGMVPNIHEQHKHARRLCRGTRTSRGLEMMAWCKLKTNSTSTSSAYVDRRPWWAPNSRLS
eukprot:405620-Pelagomonas_calceolata.AAC.2